MTSNKMPGRFHLRIDDGYSKVYGRNNIFNIAHVLLSSHKFEEAHESEVNLIVFYIDLCSLSTRNQHSK